MRVPLCSGVQFVLFQRFVASAGEKSSWCDLSPNKGNTDWLKCIKSNGYYQLGEGWYALDTHFQVPDGVTIEGAGIDKTFVYATRPVNNGCGRGAQNPGDKNTRIGFVLGNGNTIRNFAYYSKDDHRWQGYQGAALCGGAVFETPGCADAYCNKVDGAAETIGTHGDGGVSNVHIDNIRIRGDTDEHAPQLAVFITQTPNLAKPSHDIHISGIDMDKSWADGINLHGCVYNVLVESNNLAFQGDDNLAVWSSNDCAHGITFKNNIVSQKDSTNPDKTWGNCVAIYGGGTDITVTGTTCVHTSNGGVKLASSFGGSFSIQSRITVQTMNTDDGKPDCFQQSQVTDMGGTVNSCPAVQAGNDICYDPCFVHKSCTAGVGYSSATTSSMGPGWYCLDNVPVSAATATDHCCIRNGCHKGATYDDVALLWRCADDNASKAVAV